MTPPLRMLLAASLTLLSCQHARSVERSLIPPQAQALSERGLAPAESRILSEQGVVLPANGSVTSFHVGYTALFHANQPVYVTADSLLYAWHTSYDSMLMQLEYDALRPALAKLLTELRAGLATLPASEARADVDLYLAVAHSLLAGAVAEPLGGADGAQLSALVAQCEAAAGLGPLPLFGARADFDYSMLKPRGHYTHSVELQRYFRAMSFLGRVELRLANRQFDDPWVVDRRALRAAALLDSLFSASTRTAWQHLDETLASFVGPPDSMSLPGLSQGLRALGPIEQASDQAIGAAFEGVARQRIGTQLALPGERSIAFVLLGQRFVYDSKVLGALVYGALDTKRMMPSPLEVASSVFHHPLARELLEAEVQRYGAPYAAALDAQWKQTDAEDPALWTGSIYHGWLKALRELSPDAQRDQGLPAPLGSKGWGRRLLDTQLASWAELRHDNLLYAKQSVTAMALCEFPYAYVDPYPGFYEAMEQLAVRTSATIDALPYQTPRKAALLTWLTQMRATMVRLRDLAVRERANQPLRAEDLEFVNHMVSLTGRSVGCTSVTEAEGWYADLYLDRSKALWHEPVVADVHTQPTDELGNLVGYVLHVGTDRPRLMVVTLQHDGAHAQTYRGFVSTYLEKQTENFQRYTDEDWRELLQKAPPPPPSGSRQSSPRGEPASTCRRPREIPPGVFGRYRHGWLALGLPLELRPGRRRDVLVGERRGRPLMLEVGASSARLVVTLGERLPPGTHLSSEKHAPRVKLAALKDIQVGERAVDEAVVVQAANPAAIIRLLREDGVREQVPEFFDRYPSAIAVDWELMVTLDTPDEATARTAFSDTCRLADALDAALALHRQAAERARAEAKAVVPPERPKPPAPPPDPMRELRARFRRIQAWYFATAVLPALSGWGLALAAQEKWVGPQWAERGVALFLAAFVGAVASLGYYRCPACKERLAVGRRFNLLIDRCPHCAVPLV